MIASKDPRSLIEIRRMISGINSDSISISDEFVYKLFGKCRQTLEARGDASSFARLKAFCDMMLHEKLTNAKHFHTIRIINDWIDKYDSDFGKLNSNSAFDIEEVYSDLFQLLSIYGIKLEEIHPRKIMIPALRAIDGNDISCLDRVTDANGAVSVEKARGLGVSGKHQVVLSYGIRRWVSITNLECFDWEAELFVMDGRKRIFFRSPFEFGACLNCGSYDVAIASDLSGGTCGACDTNHDVMERPDLS